MSSSSKRRRRVFGAIEILEERRLLSGYTIADLGSLGGGGSQAFGVNVSGQVVGDSVTAGGQTHAFLYANGAMTDLGTLGGVESHAYGISDSGQIVGESTDVSGNEHAFLYAGGTMTNLGTLGGSTSTAEGINDTGMIVGYSATAAGATHAFKLSIGGAMSDLGTLGGTTSQAIGVNNSGQISGHSTIASGADRAFLYTGGTMTNLGTLGGPQSFAYHGINNAGAVAGDSSTSKPGQPFSGFVYSSGSLTNIGTLGGTDIFVRAMNDGGQVVGKSLTAAGGSNYDAYVYSSGTMTDLNGQIPAASGWTLNNAEGINFSGQIVGSGIFGGAMHAYLLTPAAGGGGGVTGVLTPTIGKSTVPKAVISGKPAHGTISVKLTNSSGSTVKGFATVMLLASLDTTADAGDSTVLTLKKKVNLKAHKSATFSLSVKSLPAGILAGTYTLLAEAIDPSGNAAATSTGPTITTAAPFVQLSETIGAVSPATIKGGKTGTVSVTLTNSGNIDTSGNAVILIGGSSDDANETAAFTAPNKALKVKAGKKLTVKLKFTAPANTAAGTYHPYVSISQNASNATAIGSGTFTVA